MPSTHPRSRHGYRAFLILGFTVLNCSLLHGRVRPSLPGPILSDTEHPLPSVVAHCCNIVDQPYTKVPVGLASFPGSKRRRMRKGLISAFTHVLNCLLLFRPRNEATVNPFSSSGLSGYRPSFLQGSIGLA